MHKVWTTALTEASCTGRVSTDGILCVRVREEETLTRNDAVDLPLLFPLPVIDRSLELTSENIEVTGHLALHT
jgi:hypothetical protein